MKIGKIYFSPAGGTKKIADLLCQGWEGETEEADLCAAGKDRSELVLGEEDLCIIAVPSYGGRVPVTALERLKEIRGNQAAAVLAVVYGNRAYEDTLLELKDAVKGEFRCIAAVAAVAEHSIVRECGAGRPDEKDREELKEFACRIREAVRKGRTEEVSVPGQFPYKERKLSPVVPAAGASCTACGICAESCPVGAIPISDPADADPAVCISCMRCIAVCPSQARRVEPDTLSAIARKLQKVCGERKENQLFL